MLARFFRVSHSWLQVPVENEQKFVVQIDGLGEKSHVLYRSGHGAEKTKKYNSRKINKTYSSRDSHVVTHRSTNLPFNCLCMAERTGCPVFS
ncbi:hypothetical protein KCU92_g8126, partial [Aureobasidium melanogenum]